MKKLLVTLILFCSVFGFAQEIAEEFLPIVVEDKEAFMSTKTGEYVYREHDKTNPEELRTTASGVVYNDISTHIVVKGETLSSIAKKHKLDLAQLKKDNKLKSSKLSLGEQLKIVKRMLVKSSSPVISYAGEERIIAKLRPGQSPSTIAPPPPDAGPVKVSTPEKTQSPNNRKSVSRKSTYYKPMLMPNSKPIIDKNEEVIEEVKEEVKVETVKVSELETETDEILAAQKQLEEAQRKLELAKQKANRLQAQKEAKQKAEETKEIEALKTMENAVERAEAISTEKEATAKAKYEAIQKKLEKVAPNSEEIKKTEIKKEEIKTEEVSKEKAVEVEVKETVVDTKKQVEGVDYHIIVKGDNLYNLAKTYKTTVKKLSQLNNVNFNNLKIGQKLKLK